MSFNIWHNSKSRRQPRTSSSSHQKWKVKKKRISYKGKEKMILNKYINHVKQGGHINLMKVDGDSVSWPTRCGGNDTCKRFNFPKLLTQFKLRYNIVAQFSSSMTTIYHIISIKNEVCIYLSFTPCILVCKCKGTCSSMFRLKRHWYLAEGTRGVENFLTLVKESVILKKGWKHTSNE